MLSLKTEDLLFGQQNCGFSQETVLAWKKIYQHYQCQLHSIAFSFLAEFIHVFGEGERQEEGRICQPFLFISAMSFFSI
jgi:hypothetical protein